MLFNTRLFQQPVFPQKMRDSLLSLPPASFIVMDSSRFRLNILLTDLITQFRLVGCQRVEKSGGKDNIASDGVALKIFEKLTGQIGRTESSVALSVQSRYSHPYQEAHVCIHWDQEAHVCIHWAYFFGTGEPSQI